MVFKALTSVFFLSLSLSFLQNAGVVVLLCLTAIALAARAIHAHRSKIVLDVKLSAYRARLTTHADRDETFVAARKHLVEEQGKRRYFYREYPLAFTGSERDLSLIHI